MPPSFPKLMFLNKADLPTVAPWRCSRRLRMPNLKLILYIIWAHEGEPMPRSRIIALSGLSSSQVDGCVVSLIKLGLIRRNPTLVEGKEPHPTYAVELAALKRYAVADAPLPTNYGHRLTLADARRIRDLHARQASVAAIADRFMLSREHVRKIVSNRCWKEPAR